MAKNFDKHGVGTPINVENKDWRGKTFYVVRFKMMDGTELQMSTFDEKIWQHFNAQQTIQFTYAEETKGQYTNRYLGPDLLVVSGGGVPQAQAQTSEAPAAASTTSSPDARSDQIVKQSSMYQAVSIVTGMMNSGNSPFPKGTKSKSANTDPQAWLAQVFDLAGQIKDHIFNGDWEQPEDGFDVPPESGEVDGNQEVPF